MEKLITTNLRWPGGKYRIMKILEQYLPNSIDKYYEPFVGGGSVLLYIMQMYNPSVSIANDINKALINYFNTIKASPESVIMECTKIKQRYSAKEFKELFKTLDTEKAYGFFISNKTSFSGIGRNFSSQAYENNYTINAINKISDVSKIIKDVEFRYGDYQGIGELDNFFMYLDPPYYGNRDRRLYGKRGETHKYFNHDRMFRWVESQNGRNLIMISYDDNEYIRRLYNDYNIHEFDVVYAMTNTGNGLCKRKHEIVITNY